MGTVELTGLEMMATHASGQYLAIAMHRSLTMPASANPQQILLHRTKFTNEKQQLQRMPRLDHAPCCITKTVTSHRGVPLAGVLQMLSALSSLGSQTTLLK